MQTIEQILARSLQREDISVEDAVCLLKAQTDDDREAIRVAADTLRQQQVGNTVTYVLNRNINYTNICEQHCSFCAFRRDAEQDGAYWVDWSGILEKAKEAAALGATEVCMQGGLNPEAKIEGTSLAYYCKLVDTILAASPNLHVHAFSPQEVQFIAREDNLSLEDVLVALKAAGVGSLPGTAAEVLDDSVRKILCPEKITASEWVEIVGLAHSVGLPTTSTMLSGHIETIEQQAAHLNLLRELQQRAVSAQYAGISEFILLPFVGEQAPKPLRRRVGRDQPVLADALLLTAVARIFLGNWIVNHQPSWVKLGLDGATEALRWGCNDIGGILMEEHITSMAGAVGGTCQSEADLIEAITSVGRSARQRDTLYGSVSYSSVSKEQSSKADSEKILKTARSEAAFVGA